MWWNIFSDRPENLIKHTVMKNIFEKDTTEEVISRIEKLSPESQRQWGKMSVSQMLAHCNVTYEMVYDNKHPKPGAIKRFFIKSFAKALVVGDKPYKQNLPTAPVFLVSDDKDFETEKRRLIDYLRRTQELGENYFDGKESLSFGRLNKQQWNNMFYKHLDHHLRQFGV